MGYHMVLNPLNPKIDQERISPYNTKTISSRQVMRIRKYINKEIISWFNLPNSLSYHHKNYMADSKEVYFRDLENERVKYMYVINKYGKFNTMQCGQDYFFFRLLFLIFFCTYADLLKI